MGCSKSSNRWAPSATTCPSTPARDTPAGASRPAASPGHDRDVAPAARPRVSLHSSRPWRSTTLHRPEAGSGSDSVKPTAPELGLGRGGDSHTTPAGIAPTSHAPARLADGVLPDPAERVLSPRDNAVYAFEIYDGVKNDNSDLQRATAVIRDGKVLYQSPFAPVTANATSTSTPS